MSEGKQNRGTDGQDRAAVFDYVREVDDQTTPQPRRRKSRTGRKAAKGHLRRRRFRGKVLAWLLVVVLLLVGLAASIVFLFKVTEIRVEAVDRGQKPDTGNYTAQQIVEATGIAIGDNIFSFRADALQESLSRQFPLLETIEVGRSYPGTVIVRVEPGKETFCIQSAGSWLTLSGRLKIMEITAEQPLGLLVLSGTVPANPVQGQSLHLNMVTLQDDTETVEVDPQETLQLVVGLLEQNRVLDSVTEIKLNDLSNLALWYQDRIRVELGTQNQMDYKVRMMAALLTGEAPDIRNSETGVLHLSHIRSDGTLEMRLTPFTKEEEEEMLWRRQQNITPEPDPEQGGEAPEDGPRPDPEDPYQDDKN